jgi:hypothetical protein
MLADVDYAIMGAGIPLQVPAVLDSLAENEDAFFPIDVHGMEDQYEIKFSPSDFWCTAGKPWLAERKLKRPNFVTHIYKEDILITVGDEVNECRHLMEQDKATGEWGYSAAKVVDYLKSEWNERQAQQSPTETIINCWKKIQHIQEIGAVHSRMY